MGSVTKVATPAPQMPDESLLAVSRSHSVISPILSRLTRRLAQNWRALREVVRVGSNNFWMRLRPKT